MSPFLDRPVRLTCGDIQAEKQSNENFKQLTGKKVLYELSETPHDTLDIGARWTIINFNYSSRSGGCLIGASAKAKARGLQHRVADEIWLAATIDWR